MRALKFGLIAIVLLAGVGAFEKKAEASNSFYLSFASHHPYYRSYHYRPYYWSPYRYGWGYGYGFGYGYPYYYPYSYYSPRYYYGYGQVRTEVKPKEASVFVDGDYVGTADDFDGWWQRLDIEPGRHRVVFRASGFQPHVVTLRVLPGADYNVKYAMQPGEDVIDEKAMRLERGETERDRQYSPRYRERDRRDYDRNRDYEEDDLEDDNDDRDQQYKRNGGDLNQGSYSNGDTDTGSYSNGDSGTGSFSNGDLETESVTEANKSMVKLKVFPSDATVYIDGDYYGTADVTGEGEVQILLDNGTHKIEVVRPGYESFSKDVEVGANNASSISIALQKK